MKYGIVNVPITDIRKRPDFLSERRSQVLFGDVLKIFSASKKYYRIALMDGYSGWCKKDHIRVLDQKKVETYLARPKYFVKDESILIKDNLQNIIYPFKLFFGTMLNATKRQNRYFFNLPGEQFIQIQKKALIKDSINHNKKISGNTIAKIASQFIGSPYLWGGITSAGIDCSGLVQIICRFYGIEMPRDSIDQRREGFPIDRSELRAGDLLFFDGHVAISCGGEKFIHATQKRGVVVIESLNLNDNNYREDLDNGFLFARRLKL